MSTTHLTKQMLARRTKRALYSMKRRYGGQLDIYRIDSSSTDVRLRTRTVAKTLVRVPRAVILPQRLTLGEVRTVSVISANKQMVQGGQYEKQSRKFIIDRSEVPSDFEVSTDDFCVYDGERFDIRLVDSLGHEVGWILTTDAVTKAVALIHPVKAESWALFEQGATGALS